MTPGQPAVLRTVHSAAIAAAAAAASCANDDGHRSANQMALIKELSRPGHVLTRVGIRNHDDGVYGKVAPPPPL